MNNLHMRNRDIPQDIGKIRCLLHILPQADKCQYHLSHTPCQPPKQNNGMWRITLYMGVSKNVKVKLLDSIWENGIILDACIYTSVSIACSLGTECWSYRLDFLNVLSADS